MREILQRCLSLSERAAQESGAAQSATLGQLAALLQATRDAMPAVPEGPGAPAILQLDLLGYVTAWNDAAERLFGYSAAEMLGQHVLLLYAEDDGALDELVVPADGSTSTTAEVQRRTKSGELIWVRLELHLRLDDSGEALGMEVQAYKLVEVLSPADKLNLHARIIEDSDQGVLITDANERIVSINSAFTRITGYPPEEALGKTPDLLRSGVHDAEFRARVRAAMHGAGAWRGEIIGRRKNGELFPQSVTISAVRDELGNISHTFSLFSDISLHKDAEARMQRMANYDALTGLPNLCLLNQLLGQALTEARRSQEHGALVMIEISRLGAISDTLGHEVSNEVLCEIGRRLRQALREADVLARLDGHKFAIALLHIEKREHAGIVAQKLLATLAEPFVVGRHQLQVDGHAGIAVYPEDGSEVPTLIRHAEVALNKAIRSIDSGLLFYSAEINQRAKEQMRIEGELRHALLNNELLLYYQPKVSLRSGRISGAEALIRWRHPERGLIPPGVFIPVAEETSLILDLGSWVLEEACRQIRAWQDAGLELQPIAVNLSARQFDSKLPQRIAAVLERYNVQPEKISLEITESLLVKGAESVIAIMNQLRAMGLRLALDDFGTGYSSLAYLKKFPITTLKIDRSFVIGLPNEKNDCAIAGAIVTMAKELDQEIVAEGVETVEQMDFLRGIDCNHLQGYLFSPPVPAEDFACMVREDRRLTLGPRLPPA
ncbi:EAL domain-containing protein [Duganella fentianensis]|uniref:putative bifunctional diguanylate cyclase/phosphodiesterase n=1 Tax=Duganella fentianensis TaxID=2692177 RepID=UPI0032B23033